MPAAPAAQTQKEEALIPLVNMEALKQRARMYSQGLNLPRVSGFHQDPVDQSGNPVPVGEIIVLQPFADELEEMLLPLIQDQLRAATYRMAEAYDPESIDGNGRPVIENRFRIVPPFKGSLKLDRYDKMRGLATG